MDRWLVSEPGVAVILIRIGNCTNQALRQWLSPLFSEIVEKVKAGETFIELT